MCSHPECKCTLYRACNTSIVASHLDPPLTPLEIPPTPTPHIPPPLPHHKLLKNVYSFFRNPCLFLKIRSENRRPIVDRARIIHGRTIRTTGSTRIRLELHEYCRRTSQPAQTRRLSSIISTAQRALRVESDLRFARAGTRSGRIPLRRASATPPSSAPQPVQHTQEFGPEKAPSNSRKSAESVQKVGPHSRYSRDRPGNTTSSSFERAFGQIVESVKREKLSEGNPYKGLLAVGATPPSSQVLRHW